MCVTTCLLASTAVYGAGALTGSRRLLERSRRVTPALVRRALDALAAASVAASSIGSSAAMSSASAVPPVVSVARTAAIPPLPGKVLARPVAPPVAPARVSVTALGRHFPHPGEVPHGLPATMPTGLDDEQRPTLENGFAGLSVGTKVVVVRPGDCLSVLAERHLGDWRMDGEIEALNYGRPQADGRALVDDHWIYPGWVLVMPADAVEAMVVGAAVPEATPVVRAVPSPPRAVPSPPGRLAQVGPGADRHVRSGHDKTLVDRPSTTAVGASGGWPGNPSRGLPPRPSPRRPCRSPHRLRRSPHR